MKLTTTELKILCSLSFGSNQQESQEAQLQAAAYLATIYTYGNEETPINLKEAAKYQRQANKQTPKDEPDLYTISGLYNYFRLLIVRGSLISQTFNLPLPKYFGLAGLQYGSLFVYECSYLFNATFRSPQSEEEANSTHWQRFKNNAKEDGRISRMINAGLWFTINLISYIMFGPYLVLAGFIYDFIAEVTMSIRDYSKHKRILDKNTIDLAEKRAALDYAAQHYAKDSPHYRNAFAAFKCAYDTQQQLNAKLDEVITSRLRNTSILFIVLAGMSLTLFPPLMIPGAMITAIGLCLEVKLIYDNVRKAAALTKAATKNVLSSVANENDACQQQVLEPSKRESYRSSTQQALSAFMPLPAPLSAPTQESTTEAVKDSVVAPAPSKEPSIDFAWMKTTPSKQEASDIQLGQHRIRMVLRAGH